MVEPFAAANRDAVVACQPLFTSGLDELFSLPKEKFFEVNGCGAFFLFRGKFNKFADFSHHYYNKFGQESRAASPAFFPSHA
jgi:hypothetical protein